METKETTIYEFLYCDCIHESAFATISIHKTKIGAYKAMRNYLTTEYQKWYDRRIKRGKIRIGVNKFGQHEDWFIQTRELLP